MTDQPESEQPLRGELKPWQLLEESGPVPASTSEALRGGRRLPTPAPLRDRYAAAIASYDHAVGHTTNPAPGDHHHGQADAVLAVRDHELEQARARVRRLTALHEAHLRVEQRLAREAMAAEAAIERVRALAEAANTKPKAWALHAASVLAALDGKPRPDTVITFDGQLTEEEYEALKARWIREHCGRPVATVEQRRADQAEELLRVAHETSNRSEAERVNAVRRAGLADAVTAETKRLMEHRTTTLRVRAERAEERRDQLAATLREVLDQFSDWPKGGTLWPGGGVVARVSENGWDRWDAVATGAPDAEQQTDAH